VTVILADLAPCTWMPSSTSTRSLDQMDMHAWKIPSKKKEMLMIDTGARAACKRRDLRLSEPSQ
jgi:hypothetical protein